MKRRDEAVQRQHRAINPAAQRLAVAQFVLHASAHPSADEVLASVRKRFPLVSRATICNRLTLSSKDRRHRQFVHFAGRVEFSPRTEDLQLSGNDVSCTMCDLPPGRSAARIV